MQENYYQQQTQLLRLEDLNKKLSLEVKEKNEKIDLLKEKLQELSESYKELDGENKNNLQMYNKLLELHQEKRDHSSENNNNSVAIISSEIDKEIYEKQINEINKELMYYMDLAGYISYYIQLINNIIKFLERENYCLRSLRIATTKKS